VSSPNNNNKQYASILPMLLDFYVDVEIIFDSRQNYLRELSLGEVETNRKNRVSKMFH